jgi:hypothetical protein
MSGIDMKIIWKVGLILSRKNGSTGVNGVGVRNTQYMKRDEKMVKSWAKLNTYVET